MYLIVAAREKDHVLGEVNIMDTARYTVVIEWDQEEELYIATIPALSVGSYGVSQDEAMEKIKEAAEVTIEGLKAHNLPVPHGDDDTIQHLDMAV